MAIIVPHLFLDRLSDTSAYDDIKIMIIGSFNPGMPLAKDLSVKEKAEYEILKAQGKFDRQLQLLNFYNRTNNRFWGVLDRLYLKVSGNSVTQNSKRKGGLKYYSSLEKQEVIFERQKEFCINHKIFITDIVQSLKCESFEGIYNSFTDAVLDKYVFVWNTETIFEIIRKYRPVKVLFTFKPSVSIPNISKQIQIIRDRIEGVEFLLSPSGNALNSYDQLVEDWRPHFVF